MSASQTPAVIYSGQGRWVIYLSDGTSNTIMFGLLRSQAPGTDAFVLFPSNVSAAVGGQSNGIIAVLIGLLRDRKPASLELGLAGGESIGFEKTLLSQLRGAGLTPQTIQLGPSSPGTILRLKNTGISMQSALASLIGLLRPAGQLGIVSPRDPASGLPTG